MLVSLAANSDVRRQGPGMHHTICWLSVVSCPLKKTGNILGESDMDRTGFENLRVYVLAEEMGDLVWETVIKWDRLAQDTIGKQLINSADSIGAKVPTLAQLEKHLVHRKSCDCLY